MGHIPQNGFNFYFHPEVTPGPDEEPTFDPMLGFPNGRKQREMKISEDELKAAKIPLKNRDYCAHLLMAFRVCRKDNFPFVVNCEHEKHAYLNCKYDDYIIRAKEYERERRLRVKREEHKKQLKMQEVAE